MTGGFYGKYRGVVSDNRDPNKLGRIKAKVPDVFGEDESGWAMPAVPYAGEQVGLFLVPPVNALVWIEFEHGEPDFPIWTGCFWAEGGVPAQSGKAELKVLKTDAGSITLDDDSGAITVQTAGNFKVVLDKNSITIDNGSAKIKLNGSTVAINDQGLQVT
jgi:uncharacterized protein involved in type VI secretion and phage assembly